MGMVASMMATMGLNWSGFRTGAEAAKSHAGKIGNEIKSSIGDIAQNAVGGFMIGSIIEGIPEFVGHIKDLSEQFRVSTDTIQIWDVAAKKVGLSAEDVGKGFEKLKKAREAAVEKGSVGDFGKFGINMDTLKDSAVSAEDIMAQMREAISSHPITDSESVAAMDLMGKGGSKLLSVMTELQNMGPVNLISAEDIQKVDDASKKIEALKRDLNVGGAQIAAKGMDLIEVAAGLKEFMTGNMSLNEAIHPSRDAGSAAPTKDLKGRDLTGPKAEPVDALEKQVSYKVVQSRSEKEMAQIQKDISETEKLRDQLAEKIAKNKEKALSGEERIAELKKQIAEHEKKSIAAEFGEGDEKEALKEKLKIEELKGEMDGISAKKFKVVGSDLTANQRIGAYANKPELVAIDVHKKNESHLAKMEKYLAQMAGRNPNPHKGTKY